MRISFSVVRCGVTATSVIMDVHQLSYLQRWIVSTVRMSGQDANKYNYVGYTDILDVSSTDVLEDVTGGAVNSFNIINKREITGSHLEFDLVSHG